MLYSEVSVNIYKIFLLSLTLPLLSTPTFVSTLSNSTILGDGGWGWGGVGSRGKRGGVGIVYLLSPRDVKRKKPPKS